uniref:NS3 n=1 Tax=uncultured densovirus TaxID=748192 RepID=A0A7M4CBI1_9VIRU|nr:NS3 [uncultured densovirus]
MDCVYGIEDCSCSKCAHCHMCTNGSQVHRSCLQYYCDNAEVSELMAGPEESLPTEEQENIADAIQPSVPLTAEAYFIEMGEAHAEEYKRVTFNTDVFPKTLVDFIPESGIVDGKITINRHLIGSCSILMYRLMKTQWANLICEPFVNMAAELYFDLADRYGYHEECIPDEKRDTCTPACIKIVNFESTELSEYIEENLELFFCQGCDRSIINNYCNWSAKLCSDANAALSQKNVISTVWGVDDDAIKFELQVKYDGLLKRISSSLPDSAAKRQKTDE